jgi:polyisoprenoid-binding protein YceI
MGRRTIALEGLQCIKESVRCLCYFLFSLSFAIALSFAPAFAELERFRLSPAESQIATKINDPFGNVVNGAFRLREGDARGDMDRLQETASVSLVIDAGSYNSSVGLRDQDVQEYYLEVQRYPAIRFASTSIQKIDRPSSPKEPWQITIRGQLDLHGVQREVIVPVRLLYQDNKIIAEGSFRLPLEQVQIPVPRLLFLKAGNQVQIDFRIVGERQP